MSGRGKRAMAAALALCLWGCQRPQPLPEQAEEGAGSCLSYLPQATRVGEVPPELHELSGLAASVRHLGIYWAHNDSGHALELFALKETGEVVGRFPIEGLVAPDVEDVAVGPCLSDKARTCVLLGDIGDNLRRRTFVQLIEVEEPEALGAVTVQGRAFRFAYPDGPRDAEALVVDAAGVPYVISKSGNHLGDVYRLEGLSEGAQATASHLGFLQDATSAGRFTTAADLLPDGSRLILRTYGQVWEARAAGGSTIEALITAPLRQVPGAPQPQAESIAYSRDGSGYLLGTEGAHEGLFKVHCRT